MDYIMEIRPAMLPEKRHRIHDALKSLGYKIHGGGTMMDRSLCDISFSDKQEGVEPIGEGVADADQPGDTCEGAQDPSPAIQT